MLDKYVLNFVNGGKPFDMPKWTVAKHERLLQEMIPLQEKLDKNEIKKDIYDKAYRTLMIMLSLREIDSNVKESDLESLHPDDFIELWAAVYNSGRLGILEKKDFQKGENPPIKKSP